MTADKRQAAHGPPLNGNAAYYWCEAIACTPADGRSFWLGHHHASSPRMAMRWLHSRARDIADQLDSTAARPARHWGQNRAEHERALAVMALGEPYAFIITEDATRYVLSACLTENPR
ncbi:hypothetical protein [Streptomyces xinghaiensis]|uniref:hypothetical protein n=1 Tax=Streptomyces xinghaiensis TaxID=1038928 RepID=UPI003445E406